MKVKNVIQVKLGISMNVDVSAKVKKKKKKKKNVCKKGYIWNPITYSCENCRHENWSIINDSMITCDIILETIKSILTKTVLL